MATTLTGKEFQIEEYKNAFMRVMEKNSLHDNHLRMLQIHYSAPNRAITVPRMAEEVGYKGYHGVNLQYGEVGRRISEELGYAPKKKNGEYVWTLGVAWGRRKDPKSMWEWTMYDNLAKALFELGVVR
jgi:hypothetical protein